MKIFSPSEKIYLAKSLIPKAGRGVFAKQEIKEGEIIEEAPVIELPGEAKLLKESELYNYYFGWKDKRNAAIALGYGSLYNHSYTPNAIYKKNIKNKSVDFFALRMIKKDEEITVNYNGDPDDKTPLWTPAIRG